MARIVCKNFCPFTSLLTAPLVKNSYIWLEFTLKSQTKIESLSIPKLDLTEKDRKTSFQVQQVSAPFCKVVALILGQNCLKGLRVTKIMKQVKFEGVWGQSEAKN